MSATHSFNPGEILSRVYFAPCNLQTHYDLAEAQAVAGNRLDLIEPFNPVIVP